MRPHYRADLARGRRFGSAGCNRAEVTDEASMEYRTMANDTKVAKAKVYRPKGKPARATKDLTAAEAQDQADQCVSMQGTYQEWSMKSCVKLKNRAAKAGVTLDINDLYKGA